MNVERRLFLVGVPRSGTTLLQSLLAAHSQVTSFTESHLMSRHFALLPVVGRPVLRADLGLRVREFLGENGVEAGLVDAWVRAFETVDGAGRELRTRAALREIVALFDRLAVERARSTWLEKTPRHLRYLPELEASLGEEVRATVHTIHLVRRPAETVASLYRASRDWPQAYSLDECVARWNEDVAFTLEQLDRPRQHIVLYEELCDRPEEVLHSLLGALGLDWEAGLLEEFGRQAEALVTPEETWKEGVGRPLRASSGSLEHLTAEEQAQIERSVNHSSYEAAYDRR